MALVVNTNVAALTAQRNVGTSNSKLNTSIERLSSGLRINKAADDAAGMAIATKFNAQVRGLNQAVRNANNAISLVQTAESGITTLTNVLQRLRELAVQASSDDNTTSDRATLTSEANNLVAEFTRIANTTEFNTNALLDGSFSGKYFQVGANYAQLVTFNIGDARGKSIGSRAQYDADIADGVLTTRNSNFGSGEFKVNTYDVAATASADDQYSVLDLSSGEVGAGGSTGSLVGGSFQMKINGTSVDVTGLSEATGASGALLIVSAINAASITNVTARVVNTSQWVLEATGGTTLTLFGSATGTSALQAASILGISALVGSATDASTTAVWGWGTSFAATSSNAYNGQSSAIAKAVAINSVKSNSQVLATAQKNVVTAASAISAGTITSGDIYINGVNIGDVTVTASDSTGALISAINDKTSSTGVTAEKTTDGKLKLTAADGRNITMTFNETTDATTILGISSTYLTNNTAIFRSSVRLNSESNINLSGTLGDLYDAGTTAANNITKTTDTTKSQATDLATYNVAGISIDTQDDAQAAILTLDAAFNDLNNLRSTIGAIQNRLQFTVDNLQVTSENMSAAESRIRDADFAMEVSIFTKNQILVQAGTSILAQANSLSQVALQLLQ